MNQTQPMYQTQTMAPARKPNYTLIGIITVAAIAVIIVVILVLTLGGGRSLVGTWATSLYGYEMSLTFKANGTVETNSDGTKETAKYQIKGDTLIVTTEDGTVSSGQYKISRVAGKTELDLTFEGMTLTLYKK